MKPLFLFILSVFFVHTAMAQRDSAKVIKPAIINKTVTKAATLRVNSVEMTMNQIDLKLNELQTLIDKLKNQKDALSDMSQDDKMKLQQIMDRKSKFETMLSNILKKFSDTSSGIIQNLK